MTSWFIIQSIVSGLVFNVYNGNLDPVPGAPIQLYAFPEPNGDFNTNELWTFNDTYIASQLTGYVLDVESPGTEGSRLVVAPPSGSLSQQWHIDYMTGYLTNDQDLVATVQDNNFSELAPVVAAAASGQDGQKIQLVIVYNEDEAHIPKKHSVSDFRRN